MQQLIQLSLHKSLHCKILNAELNTFDLNGFSLVKNEKLIPSKACGISTQYLGIFYSSRYWKVIYTCLGIFLGKLFNYLLKSKVSINQSIFKI